MQRGPFLERNGQSANEIIEQLVAPPEKPLTPEARERVLGFENKLFDSSIEVFADGKATLKTLGEVFKDARGEEEEAPFFFSQYFLEKQPLLEALVDKAKKAHGVQLQVPNFHSAEEVYDFISVLIEKRDTFGLSDDDFRDHLSNPSRDYSKEKLSAALAAQTPLEAIDTMLSEHRPLVINPDKTMQRMAALDQVRDHLLNMRPPTEFDENSEVGRELGAHRAVIDVYLSKTNALIADYASRLYYLYDQAQATKNNELVGEVKAVLPASLHSGCDDKARRLEINQRLDHLRNGVDFTESKNGNTVAEMLWKLTAANEHAERVAELPVFTPEEVAKLDAYKVASAVQQEIFETILARTGHLSSEPSSSYSSERIGRAHDGKWQVIEHPDKDSFAVDSIKGVYKVCPSPRSLKQIIEVGGAHELTHIDQGDADQALANTLKIAGVKGKRVSMLREGGANVKQRQAKQAIFGEQPRMTPNMTYAAARIALDEQQGPIAAAQAFYEQKMQANPNIQPVKAATEAADRVLRLMRNGETNSQPMSYAEEFLLMNSLNESTAEVKARGGMVTAFDLVDQLRLHRYGLLPELSGGSGDWMPVVLEVLTPHIQKALRATTEAES
ncbi:MAG TPA: hypothetical protein VFZ58_01370 [Candidatus Saccharimonadales bacterium]